MGSAIEMRTDYSAVELQRLTKRSRDSKQSRRLLSLAAVLDSLSREELGSRHGPADVAGPGSSLQSVRA